MARCSKLLPTLVAKREAHGASGQNRSRVDEKESERGCAAVSNSFYAVIAPITV